MLIFLAGCIFRKDSPSLTFSYYNNQGLTPDSYNNQGLTPDSYQGLTPDSYRQPVHFLINRFKPLPGIFQINIDTFLTT